MTTKSKIIVALDFPHIDLARNFIAKVTPQLCRLKIASTMFTHYGPDFIRELVNQGFDVFLDLKFYDIPMQVAGACLSCAELGVWMINVHVSGGRRMLSAAVEALDKIPQQKRPLLIGVTVLTSMEASDLAETGIHTSVIDRVIKLATLAKEVGLDGVVCSSQEAKILRAKLGVDFLLVTPGIRFADDQPDDQRRVLTPEAAIAAGSDYLVIGRSIVRVKDPKAMLEKIYQRNLIKH